MSELVIYIFAGLLRLLEVVVLLMSNVAVAAPQALQPGYELGPRVWVDVLTWPVRAAARHPRRLALALVVVAICVAVAWRF